jgi:hypothetical protein
MIHRCRLYIPNNIKTTMIHRCRLYTPNNIKTTIIHRCRLYIPNNIKSTMIHRCRLCIPNNIKTTMIHRWRLYTPHYIKTTRRGTKITQIRRNFQVRVAQKTFSSLCCTIKRFLCSVLKIKVCPFVPFLLVIILSVLRRSTASNYPFGIYRLFCWYINTHNNIANISGSSF